MSDLCSYEFEDIVWDDFCQSDDHIVPHPGSGRADHSVLGDTHKKPYHEIISTSNCTGDRSSTAYGDKGSEQGAFSSLSKRRSTMLENDSCSSAPSAVLPSSSDSDANKDTSSLASENTTSSGHAFKSSNADSNHNEFCGNVAILGEKTSAVDNPFTDTLDDITHTGNNLDFFENREDKDCSDMLYYGWPEIGNFEDVDRMFRSCDSTFGLAAMKDDEFGWFPSAENIGESGDVEKPEFKFPYGESNPVENISQKHNSSNCSSANDSTVTSVPTRFNHSYWTSEKSDSYTSLMNGPAMANGNDGFIPRQQMIDHKKLVKLPNQSTRKRKEHYFGDRSYNCMSNVPNEAVQLPLSYTHSDNSPWSDLTSVNPTTSVVKSETYDLAAPSPRDSSHAFDQLQLNSHDPKFQLAAAERSGRREKLHAGQGNQTSAYSSKKKASRTVQAAIGDPGTGGKLIRYSGDDSDSHRDTGGFSPVIPIELCPSDIQERSMISGTDDTSLEAASFRQLQLVMEQLDMRTKMCIRDSLYRLARSAEQRNNHANLNRSCGDEREASGAFLGEGTHNSFMDIETDTNPIDRSIAHLLFHRPSESSAIPVHDSLQVHGPVGSPPIMVELEDMVVCEETETMMEKVSDTDCKC